MKALKKPITKSQAIDPEDEMEPSNNEIIKSDFDDDDFDVPLDDLETFENFENDDDDDDDDNFRA